MESLNLAHVKWKCQYYIVFISKYRRNVLYGEIRVDEKEAMTKLCALQIHRNIIRGRGADLLDPWAEDILRRFEPGI